MAHEFALLTNLFWETFITNGTTMHQQLERMTAQPDFLFCAADTGEGGSSSPWYVRTSADGWQNNAAANGCPTNAGPGVIRPPVRIAFHKAGGVVYAYDTWPESGEVYSYPTQWGSFDDSTNASTVYPCLTAQDNSYFAIRLRLWTQNGSKPAGTGTWRLPVPFGSAAALQISTNLVNWTTCTVVTNHGGITEWHHTGLSRQQRFFRVVPR